MKKEIKTAAYEQIKKLGGHSLEAIKTIKTSIGEVDIKVRAEFDTYDLKKAGGNVFDRPYVYRGSQEGIQAPLQLIQKIDSKVYETAEAAFAGTKAIVEKYIEGLNALEAL